MEHPIILITGATAGFGKACAEKFARGGYDLILTGRRAGRLTKLQTALENDHGVRVLPLSFDVRDPEACSRAVASIPHEWQRISVLLNNAGLAAGLAPIDQGALDDWETMIDTNVKGLLYMTRLVIPFLKQQHSSQIINMGSTAAKDVYPNGNVYCATKHAVGALSEAMRIDLLPYGIRVTAVHPGAAETEFSQVRFKGDEQRAAGVYEGFTPLSAEDVADAVYFCATRPAHVSINDLVITCTAQANALFTFKAPSKEK
jgi:NADP-dependent 3-hydroxy acid dehydrogenase YdfG